MTDTPTTSAASPAEDAVPIVTIYAHVVAQEQTAGAIEQACLSIVQEVLQEDGCLTYHLLRDVEDDRVFAWFEQWRDEEAFQRHLSSPHAARLGAALEGKLEEPMVIRRYASLC
ncbi:MAG: antibiotic biosynthesis monooxygenase [Actinomycetota bacterium]|nr:antibiotic biosynthesis monooxygenase [Actinomycetota bacterium]